MLQRAEHDLRMNTVGPMTAPIAGTRSHRRSSALKPERTMKLWDFVSSVGDLKSR